MSLKQLLKEPLTHFLLIGCALFVAFELVGDAPESKRIVVDEARLLTQLRLGSNPLEPTSGDLRLEDLSPDELEHLVGTYVREEALYREARALGLDDNDAVFRRQLIRRLESVNQMVVSSGIRVTQDDLEAYLAEYADRYRLPPTITFTHVFFSIDRRGVAEALAMAESMLEKLNARGVPFHEAPALGDRFLYHPNYAAKAAGEVTSHFGEPFRRRVFSREPDDVLWFGPLRSSYGYHLVLLTGKTTGWMPPLEEVRRRVEADAFQARLQEEVDRISAVVVEGYTVEIDEALRARIDTADASRLKIED